jgi:hypothetical protein
MRMEETEPNSGSSDLITEAELDALDAAERAATAGPWPKEPGYGPDEDEGDWVIGAVGPSHRYLIDDAWDYDDMPQPSVLLEAEAKRRAEADQHFVNLSRNLARKLIATVRQLPRGDAERERVRLAGCGVAALGYVKDGELKPGDYGHSASRDDVLRLRQERDELAEQNALLWKVAEAARNERQALHNLEKQDIDLDTCDMADRIDALAERVEAWERLTEALAALPPRAERKPT